MMKIVYVVIGIFVLASLVLYLNSRHQKAAIQSLEEPTVHVNPEPSEVVTTLQTRPNDLLDAIKDSFEFLISNYGFHLLQAEQQHRFIAKNLLIYRSEQAKLQLEICADESYFHCEIRKLMNGEPARYSDEENCIGFEDLAKLESNNQYNHMIYYVQASGLKTVLKEVVDLFQRNKDFFTSDGWIDTKKIEALEDEAFFQKFGFCPSDNKKKPTYYGELKKKATDYLTNRGFVIKLDSEELPPYDREALTKNIVFSKADMTVKFSQQDWRDDYFIYYVIVNNEKIFEIDTTKFSDLNEAVDMTLQSLGKVAL